MADINGLLGKFLNGGVGTGLASGLAGGLAGSMLMTKSGRKIGKSALKLGGVAAVGALAYSAYQKFNNNQNTVSQNAAANNQLDSAPDNSGFLPANNDIDGTNKLGVILVRAMIAAARADGRMSAQERQAIYQQIQSLDLDEEQKQLLIEEMGRPVDMDAIVRAATSPEIAAEIYTVSLLAIDDQNAAENAYLSMLAARMKLPRGLVKTIEDEVNNQKMLN